MVARNFDPLFFCGSYAPWNLENIRILVFLCRFFINEITASDAGPDIIRSHLFRCKHVMNSWNIYEIVKSTPILNNNNAYFIKIMIIKYSYILTTLSTK